MDLADALLLAAGILFLALAIGVVLLRRAPTALAVAAFCLGNAVWYVVAGLTDGAAPGRLAPLLALARLCGAAGTIALILLFPAPLTGRGWRPLAFAGAVTVCIFSLGNGSVYLDDPTGFASGWGEDLSQASFWLLFATTTLDDGALIAAMLVFALRARALPVEERGGARSLGILGVGILLLVALSGSAIRAAGANEAPIGVGLAGAFMVLVPVLAWLYATRGAHHAIARNVVLASVAIAVIALLPSVDNIPVVRGVGVLIGALLLVYAVMRGLIEGLDVKVRFALSKSTLAAIFIAVFFIASEAAQQFFGERLESNYLGIIAAGALVFAIAPLSRVADRLAQKAVPMTGDAEPFATQSLPASVVAFRSAVRVASHDGAVTSAEERHLADVADALGLTHAEVARARRDVEEEAGP